MKRIYKYELNIIDEQTIDLPTDAKILCVLEQKHNLCVWAVINLLTPQTYERRIFRIYGTGHIMHSDGEEYIGTTMIDKFVWHLFEVKEV